MTGITTPICGPICGPVVGAVTERVVGGLSTPTKFVSQSATNGFAVGVDSGTGSSRESPWLTLDYAIAHAVDGDVILVNDGTYTAATFYTLSAASLEVRAANRRAVILRAAATQIRVFNLTSTGAALPRSHVLRGLVLDGQSDTQGAVTIGSSSITATLTIALIDCEMRNTTQRLVLSSSQKGLNLSIIRCAASGTWAGLNLVQILAHESGTIKVSGLSVNGVMSNASTKNVIAVTSATLNSIVSVSGLTGTVTASGSSGGLYGVVLTNCNGARIEGNNFNVAGPATSVGAIYWIKCLSASLTANNGYIRNNAGSNQCDGGYLAIYGQDGSSAGDGLQNNGEVSGNTLVAKSNTTIPIHGCFIGFGTGGKIFGNTVTGSDLAIIAKQQTGGEIYGNTVNQCSSQALRAKGSSGTYFHDNIVNLSEGFDGDCMTVDANTSPATNSTGIIVSHNKYNVDVAPGFIVTVPAGNDANFSDNEYDINAVLGSGAWNYQGTSYDTLAAWKAVEPSARP